MNHQPYHYYDIKNNNNNQLSQRRPRAASAAVAATSGCCSSSSTTTTSSYSSPSHDSLSSSSGSPASNVLLVDNNDNAYYNIMESSSSSSSPQNQQRKRRLRRRLSPHMLATKKFWILLLLGLMAVILLLVWFWWLWTGIIMTIRSSSSNTTGSHYLTGIESPTPSPERLLADLDRAYSSRIADWNEAYSTLPITNETEWPLIHIVNTRFMQHQANLLVLGEARYYQFMTFCFPTMIHQTNQDFLWILKTDPEFPETSPRVWNMLVESVQNHSNIYLVASNTNFLTNPGEVGSWKDGAEPMDLLSSKIYTGNITRLHQAMALRHDRPVLETRLDADDGLHLYYIQYIQLVALQRFLGSYHPPQWLYWCTRRHLEWHSSIENSKNTSVDMSKGFINPVQHDKLCVTPGITIGYNIDVDPLTVPVHSHDALFIRLHNSTECYYNNDNDNNAPLSSLEEPLSNVSMMVEKTDASEDEEEEEDGGGDDDEEEDEEEEVTQRPCLELVESFLFCALRSRTWTSHGMRQVAMPGLFMEKIKKKHLEESLWDVLKERFYIFPQQVQKTQTFLTQHQVEIAQDNLLGQCTHGHSCKNQSKAYLSRLITKPKNKNKNKNRQHLKHQNKSNTTMTNNIRTRS